jgi:heat shock protein HtpX
MNYFKTFVLMFVMGGLILLIGQLVGGRSGLIIALGFAVLLNFFSYWFSDRIVLYSYGAKPITASDSPYFYQTVQNLSARMDLPMPKLYIINMEAPNAFATGRNPDHAAVAVSPSILSLLNKHELEAVIAHELTHIKNRDILVATIAATIAATVMMAARIAQFSAFFGIGRDRDDEGGNPIALLLVAILAPVAAILVQLAISRTREYMADEGAAEITNKPGSLASALQKLTDYSHKMPLENVSPASSHLFIVNPMKESWIINLFSTHPSLGRRKKNLEKVSERLGLPF